MTGGLLSGGIVLAIAALLWVIYLVPTWIRRSQYLATERNVVRLQQTMRILAETSEVPEEVRVEVTAREVAEKQRILRKVQAEALERARAEVIAQVGRDRVVLSEAARVARARRRTRMTTTIVMLGALIGAVLGGWRLAALGEGALLIASMTVAGLCIALLTRMAKVAARDRVVTPVAPAVPVATTPFEPVVLEDEEPVAQTWTPRPLPKPLYQSQGSAAADAMAQADAYAELRRAALAQVMAQRAAELVPDVPRLEPRRVDPMPAASQAPSEPETGDRFAAMGIVDDPGVAIRDVSELMRRRRAAS